jgi:murein DD-endopeptidase MepM/ murein hydrolase activator NlpD
MKRLRVLSPLILLMASLLPAAPAAAQAQGPVYIVQAGDSCSYIASQFGVSMIELMQVNDLGESCLIHPGDRMVLPGMEGISGILTGRTVELGESLRSIALRYGMTSEMLYRLNHVVNPERVAAGQTIIVTEPEEGTPGPPRWENGRTLTIQAGEPLLALAAAAGKNPWEVASQNGLSSMADQFTGRTILMTGGETLLRAWPEPVREIRFRSLPLVQGSTNEVYLAVEGEATAEGNLGDAALHFRPAGVYLAALQGSHVQAKPGFYPFAVTVTLPGGGTVSFQQDVALVAGVFGDDGYLTVNPETLSAETIAAEAEQTRQIVAPFTDPRSWDGVFQRPATRDIGAEFGNWRVYNSGAFATFHTGVDFYGRVGEPVLAPAPGKVIFAGPLTICGNTTIIDHGWGVYTRYCHQDAFEVNIGDVVATGQEIGKIGKTGRADGPHLHFEVWVGGVQVNPMQWFAEVFP